MDVIIKRLIRLAAEYFLIPLRDTETIFYKPSPGTVFFSMFSVWHRLFSLVLMFPRLKIEALAPSTVQGKCIYTIFKAENQEIV